MSAGTGIAALYCTLYTRMATGASGCLEAILTQSLLVVVDARCQDCCKAMLRGMPKGRSVLLAVANAKVRAPE